MLLSLPNVITCLNLFSGCVGIVFAFNGDLKSAGYAILLSAFFDFFDGLAARALRISSNLGKELDSLADVISFGFLPSVIIYQLIGTSTGLIEQLPWLQYAAFVLTIFSALRLAKFNIDTRQSDSFIGLPVPSSALVVLSIPYLVEQPGFIGDIFQSTLSLLILIGILSLLMISELPLIALKFKSLDVKQNIYQYALIIIGIILFVLFKFAAVGLIIVTYILLSILKLSLNR
ncbi:CDP-diacylglycerol--serine O-phosphatidyltransferase [Albibacterium profundi]|uniref:CDP-diacylglycerol--serine O-phosphatidyltransferase n=1 Tax=Albibacterium profundi TaxID=3134906 RepID=A0ABV5CBR2_9SPHI